MTYGVIGLGHFGHHVAEGLLAQGNRLVVADRLEERIREIAATVENAFVLDATDKTALKEAGLVELDIVVVSLGANIEGSILATMALVELGNKTVIVKAKNAIHGEALAKVGAGKIIYPEREMAKKIVKAISKNVILDMIDISNSFKGITFPALPRMQGKPVQELGLTRYRLTLAAIKQGGRWITVTGEERIEEEALLFCIGQKQDVETYISEVLR